MKAAVFLAAGLSMFPAAIAGTNEPVQLNERPSEVPTVPVNPKEKSPEPAVSTFDRPPVLDPTIKGGTFSRPPSTFTRPETTFDRPASTFSRPESTFSRTETTFERPATTFSRPAVPLAPMPQSSFSRPTSTFPRPVGGTFESPGSTFSRAATTFERVPSSPRTEGALSGAAEGEQPLVLDFPPGTVLRKPEVAQPGGK